MALAYLGNLGDYWWLILAIVFGLLMFGGRRLDAILDKLADRKMSSRYGKLEKKHEVDLKEDDIYISELLGVDVRLDDLIKRIYDINEKLVQNKMERVSYLELWILVKLYGRHLVKSEDRIYYVHSKHFITNLELSFRDVNSWALEFANSKEIREMKISAAFILHNIRTKDPSCDPKHRQGSSAIAGAVFDREYIFSSRNVSTGLIGDELGLIEMKDGTLIELSESGFHNIGKRDQLTISEQIKGRVRVEKKEQVYSGYSSEKNSEETTKHNSSQIKIASVDENGSQKLVDNKGREFTVKSDILSLEKSVNENNDESKKRLLGEDEKIPEAQKPLLHSEQEKAPEEETVIDVKSLLSSSRHATSGETKKQVVTKKREREATYPKERQEKDLQEKESASKKGMNDFLESLPKDKKLFSQYLSKERNEIYFCEEQQVFFLSMTHILYFLEEHVVNADAFVSSLFHGPKFNGDIFDNIIRGLAASIGEDVAIEDIRRRSFHRADDGYKEVYTFAIINGVVDILEKYPEAVVRGRMRNKYKDAKCKVFVENYRDLSTCLGRGSK